uniref:C-type mannose receptor 2 n=2 Tax=Cynoglossus semilaevis TaxID=244447 RepID=A0A3P8WM47_CYNSE
MKVFFLSFFLIVHPLLVEAQQMSSDICQTRTQLSRLTCIVGLVISGAHTRDYHFVSIPLNWTEAQIFCRDIYTDLVTIENTEEITAVLDTTSDYTGQAWIGLSDDLENGWRWSLSNSIFYSQDERQFKNWDYGYPLGGPNRCVELFGDVIAQGKWGDAGCDSKRPFVCYSDLNDTSFVKIEQPLNWTDAQKYCRKNYVDLASVRSNAENAIIANLTSGDSVWIGLFWDKVWSDGSTSLFRHWAEGESNSSVEECVTTAFSDVGLWSGENCSLSFPFVCYTADLPNAENFMLTQKNTTSITLQWDRVSSADAFVLQYDDMEINITASYGEGPMTYTVSFLTAGTDYEFTLFSEFQGYRSSGVNINAATDKIPVHVVRLNMMVTSLVQLSQTDLDHHLEKLVGLHGLSPKVLSIKVKSDSP